MFAFYNTLGLVSYNQENNRDKALRAISGGVFSMSNVPDMRFEAYVWADPTSEADRRTGGICSVTGYWAPGHRLVSTSRGRAIDVFAPNDKVIQ
jgi:hypothetical protein